VLENATNCNTSKFQKTFEEGHAPHILLPRRLRLDRHRCIGISICPLSPYKTLDTPLSVDDSPAAPWQLIGGFIAWTGGFKIWALFQGVLGDDQSSLTGLGHHPRKLFELKK